MLQDGYSAVTAGSQYMCQRHVGAWYLPGSAVTTQLHHQFNHLPQVRGSDWLALADESTTHVDRDVAADGRATRFGQATACTGAATPSPSR